MAGKRAEHIADILTASYFAPKKWGFWRAVIISFCAMSLIGHGLEVPYCTIMDNLFGIVEDDYAVFNDPWFVPYWVYGFGALGMTFVLEPLKDRIVRQRQTLLGALIEMFVLMVFLAMAMELLFGLIINQPDATGDYPYWDNSQLPLNVFKQAWLVNDVFIGLAAMIYLWIVFPLVCTLFRNLKPRTANLVFVLILLFFIGCVIATGIYFS